MTADASPTSEGLRYAVKIRREEPGASPRAASTLELAPPASHTTAPPEFCELPTPKGGSVLAGIGQRRHVIALAETGSRRRSLTAHGGERGRVGRRTAFLPRGDVRSFVRAHAFVCARVRLCARSFVRACALARLPVGGGG